MKTVSKKIYFCSVLVAVAGLFSSCGSLFGTQQRSPAPPAPSPQFYGSGLTASHEESEIILNSSPGPGNLTILIDGALRQTMLPQDSVKIIVPNGQHTITVNWTGKDNNGRDIAMNGDALAFNANSMQYVYSITVPPVLIISAVMAGRKVTLNSTSETPLSGRLATSDSRGIQGAVIRTAEQLASRLPKDSTVAVLSIYSDDSETSQLAIDELEYQLLESRAFKLVNRNQLNQIRTEQNLGISGDISDESMVSIGQLLAADIVITGSITGSGSTRTLTLRALDVETGEYEMTREAF